MCGLLMFIIAIVIFITMVKIINKNIENNNKKNSTINYNDLLNKFANYFAKSDKLYITDDIYLTCTSKANALTSYDIFMNDEYISDLETYSKAYPSGFNNFAKKILGVKISENKEGIIAKTTQVFEKGCKYYIDDLSRLNAKIPNETISIGLDETVVYLKEIQKIETEFPECKDKTKKLYQYYLPMLSDILQNYHRLAANTTENEEFKSNEDRLCKTIVLINAALKNISATLIEDYYTDLKVDMKTLEAVLKKDGLVDGMENSTKEEN